MLPGRTDRSVRARKSWGQACLPPPNPTTHARPGQSLPFAPGAAVLTLAAHRHRWGPSPHGGPPPQRVWLNGPGRAGVRHCLKKLPWASAEGSKSGANSRRRPRPPVLRASWGLHATDVQSLPLLRPPARWSPLVRNTARRPVHSRGKVTANHQVSWR